MSLSLRKKYLMSLLQASQPSGRLPSGYQEVEYIESSGTQYIRTGVTQAQYLKAVEDWAVVTIDSEARLSGLMNPSSPSCRCVPITIDTNYHTTFGQGGGTSYIDTTVVYDYQKHTFEVDNINRVSKIDGATTSTWSAFSSTTPNNTNYDYTLFGRRLTDVNTVSNFMKAKLYSAKLYKSGTLVRDFVPCYRKSDSEIGLYDLVNDVFYTNQGSGVFTKGQDVIYTPTNAVSFATDSWDVINAEAERISNFYETYGMIPFNTPYRCGDTRSITLSTNEQIQIMIWDMCHDDLTSAYSGGGTKAGITWGMVDCLPNKYPLNTSATNSGGWENCQFRAYTIPSLLMQLPSGLYSVLKNVEKKTSIGSNLSTISTTTDKLFLPSVIELYGVLKRIHNGNEEYAFAGEGTEYQYFKNAPAITSVNNITWPQYKDTGTSISNGQAYLNLKNEVTSSTPNNAYINYYGVKLLGNTSATTDYFTRSPNVGSTVGFCYIAGTSGTVYSRGSNNVAGIVYAGCI